MLTKFEKNFFIKYPKINDILSFLPNYDQNKNKLNDFIEIHAIRYDENLYFDDINDPIPEDLKLDLYMYGYLEKFIMCYTLYYQDDNKIQKISLLNYDIVKKLSEELYLYNDIKEYPKIRITLKEDQSYKICYEKINENDIKYMKNDEFFDIIYNRPFTMEKIIDDLKWHKYSDIIKQLFDSDKRLNRHRNLFRIRKIKSILDE